MKERNSPSTLKALGYRQNTFYFKKFKDSKYSIKNTRKQPALI